MFERIRQLSVVVILLSVALATAACGGEAGSEDIQPIGTVEMQTAPETEPETQPTASPNPTSTPAPTPTNLPTELGEPGLPSEPISPVQEPTMAPASGQVQPLPGSENALAAATADLAERTGVPASDISLVSLEAVDWSDASLGCPQEGYMYAQVITPGFSMILSAQGQQYEYHTDQAGNNVVLCEP